MGAVHFNPHSLCSIFSNENSWISPHQNNWICIWKIDFGENKLLDDLINAMSSSNRTRTVDDVIENQRYGE